jgi:ComF family protein
MQQVVRSLANQVLDFALPPRCPGCGTIILEPHKFCLECWKALELLAEPCCACCGLPFAYEGQQGGLCGACLAEPPAYDRLRAAVAYGPIARQVALKLKYAGRPGVAETLARLMDRHLIDLAPDAIIAPVPLHRWRIWKRGYNQAALIARSLQRRTRHEMRLDLLKRVKATPLLRGLGRRERALAVRGAIAVDPRAAGSLGGKTVVLVDDVHTSGATANACARALKRAGAARVEVLCWARVVATEG